MEKDTEKLADGRWIFPKEKEGLYSDEMLRFFIAEAETYVQDTVKALVTVRDRFYTVINILLVIIGAVSTVLFTCPTLTASHRLFLCLLLIYSCIICAVSFTRLKTYCQKGPGIRPNEIVGDDYLEGWMRYYHGGSTGTECLYSLLEWKQAEIDSNQQELDRQLAFLRWVTAAMALAMAAVVAVLIMSVI